MDILIFCDTICILDNKIVEKPKNRRESIDFLSKFSNKTH